MAAYIIAIDDFSAVNQFFILLVFARRNDNGLVQIIFVVFI